jgi:hypothetical protein
MTEPIHVPGVPDVVVKQIKLSHEDAGFPYNGFWYAVRLSLHDYLHPDLIWRENCWFRGCLPTDHGYYPSKDDAIQAAQMWWDRKQEGK